MNLRMYFCKWLCNYGCLWGRVNTWIDNNPYSERFAVLMATINVLFFRFTASLEPGRFFLSANDIHVDMVMVCVGKSPASMLPPSPFHITYHGTARGVWVGTSVGGFKKEVMNYLSGGDLPCSLESPLTAALWDTVGVGASRWALGEWVTAHHERVVQWELLDHMVFLWGHWSLRFDLKCRLRGRWLVMLG